MKRLLSEACQGTGYPGDSFHRFKECYDRHGKAGLQEISRKKPALRHQVNAEIVQCRRDTPQNTF